MSRDRPPVPRVALRLGAIAAVTTAALVGWWIYDTWGLAVLLISMLAVPVIEVAGFVAFMAVAYPATLVADRRSREETR